MDIIVVIGPGLIGQAIARRVGVGKHVVLADLREANANAAAKVLYNAGYQVTVATADASDRDSVHELVETATALGPVTGLIHAAGVSPSQAPPEAVLHVDLYGTALVLEAFGEVIAPGRLGRGHRLAVRAPPAAAARGAEPRAGHDTGRGAARAPVPAARPGHRLPPRLSVGQARQLPTGDG